MLLTTADFKKGLAILVDKAPFLILECNTQTPTARGSATLVRTKIRNILTGQVFDRTFKSGEKFETPDLERRPVNFLYQQEDDYHFMDEKNYEQFHLNRETLGDAVRWIIEGIIVRSVVFEGKVVGVELPQFVEIEIVETGPGGRSDMASGKVTKNATLVNGTTL